MRFLIDNNLSPVLAKSLKAAGHDAVHVRDIGLQSSADSAALSHPHQADRVIASAATAVTTPLARSQAVRAPVLVAARRSGRAAAPRRPVSRRIRRTEGRAACERARRLLKSVS